MHAATALPADAAEAYLLREMVRQAERALEVQFRSFERADRRSEQLLGLAVAALGAGGVLVRTVPANVLESAALPALIVMGMVCNGGAALLFLRAYLMLREHASVRTGPSPEWIAVQSRREALAEASYLRQVLRVMADDFFENLSNVQRAVRVRGLGLRWLLAGVMLYAAPVFYSALPSG